jgi:hypothetical protein
MRGLSIEPEAEAELEAAAMRYEAANSGLGAQFLGEIGNTDCRAPFGDTG